MKGVFCRSSWHYIKGKPDQIVDQIRTEIGASQNRDWVQSELSESYAVKEEGFSWRFIVSYWYLLWLKVNVQEVTNKSNFQSKPCIISHPYMWQYLCRPTAKNSLEITYNYSYCKKLQPNLLLARNCSYYHIISDGIKILFYTRFFHVCSMFSLL
jgi:hypothetical protein